MRGNEVSSGATALSGENGPVGLPIGPGSLTWQLLGDRRLLLFLGRTGTLQNMHPAVGAALQDHSNFFDDPWDRLLRSIPQILGVIYDAPDQGTAIKVRDYHKDLKGTDANGRRYHALSPDVFWWTHATFIEVLIAMRENFGTPLTLAEKNQLIAEGITWWQQYGMSMSPVLTDYTAFTVYWDRMLATELESNATTDYAVSVSNRRIPPPPGVPALLWAPAQRPVMAFNVWLLTALMPERGREILDLSWNRRDRAMFRAFAGAVRLAWPVLPERVRYFPRTFENIRRVREERAA